MHVFVLCNPDLVFHDFQQAFVKVGRSQTVTCATNVITEVAEIKEVSEPLEVAQSKLVMGFRTQIAAPQKEMSAVRLMTAMFGGTPHSKLFLNVREKLSLCYYCTARYNRHKGILLVESGVETKNIEAAKKENIFIRYFNLPRIDNHLRISIGTDGQMDILLSFIKKYMKSN